MSGHPASNAAKSHGSAATLWNTKCHWAKPLQYFKGIYVVTKQHMGDTVAAPRMGIFQANLETVAVMFANPGFEQPTRRKSSPGYCLNQ